MLKKPVLFLVISLVLVLFGSALSKMISTAGGEVTVSDLRFPTASGGTMSALLYKPDTASAENKAPGVLAIHGYINSRETQSGFAIELARRGFVVLAIDQSGHGYTDPPAFANAFGATDGLTYLRSLPFVDTNRIGLEGHSMGGWASRAATQQMPDQYHAIVMEGSSTTSLAFGNFTGSANDPKNIAIVFSLYDEFSEMMWRGSKPQDLASSPILMELFGTDSPVEVGKLYGDIEQGTGRILYQPATTHPGDHISPEAILNAVSWLQLTLNQPSEIAPDDHIFLWKELGTLIALVGIILFIFPLCQLLLYMPFFASLKKQSPVNHRDSGVFWWIGALLTTTIPAASFFVFYDWTASTIPGSWFWPQNITTAIAGWAVLNGLITLALLSVRHWSSERVRGSGFESYGLTISLKEIFSTIILATVIMLVLSILAAGVQSIFNSDFRFWVVALKPMSWPQWKIFFCYLPIFVLFFLAFSANLMGPLRSAFWQAKEQNLAAQFCVNALIASGGFIVLLLIQYASLFQTGTLLINQSLLTIVAIQFVPLLIVIACITTYCFRITGRSYLGALVNGLFVTWYIVAGQATHIV
ncbi:alpha/beta hydrolase family protein [Aurantivibrio infirmus]